MAVHAYLHRIEGSATNTDYWYQRSGRSAYRKVTGTGDSRVLREADSECYF